MEKVVGGGGWKVVVGGRWNGCKKGWNLKGKRKVQFTSATGAVSNLRLLWYLGRYIPN